MRPTKEKLESIRLECAPDSGGWLSQVSRILIFEEIDALESELTQALKDLFAYRHGNRDLHEKNEQLTKEVEDWKQGSGVEARLGDEARREVAELKRELGVARERLGPAGYYIISEVAELRKKLEEVQHEYDLVMIGSTKKTLDLLATKDERDQWYERYGKLKGACKQHVHCGGCMDALAADAEYDK